MQSVPRNIFSSLQSLCCDDEYTHRGVVYGLDYRPVDGDVSREQNALVTSSFKPHGKLYHEYRMLEVRSYSPCI